MHRHERRHPTPSELAHGAGLLDAIPSAGRNWNTPQGAAFIAWAEQLSRYGDVPTAWLAEDLGLEPGTVYTTMTRYRQSA